MLRFTGNLSHQRKILPRLNFDRFHDRRAQNALQTFNCRLFRVQHQVYKRRGENRGDARVNQVRLNIFIPFCEFIFSKGVQVPDTKWAHTDAFSKFGQSGNGPAKEYETAEIAY